MSMKKCLAVGTALVSLSCLPASDANAFTGTASASAIFGAAVTVAGTAPLHFGEFVGDGTVTVTPAGARSSSAGISEVVGAGLETNGSVLVTGASGVAIDLAIASTATLNDGTRTMTLGSFHLSTVAGGTTATVTLPAAGTSAIPFGATLTVPALPGRPAGTYTGTFNVTVDYQ